MDELTTPRHPASWLSPTYTVPAGVKRLHITIRGCGPGPSGGSSPYTTPRVPAVIAEHDPKTGKRTTRTIWLTPPTDDWFKR